MKWQVQREVNETGKAGLFKPQTVLLRWKGLRGGGSSSGDGQTFGTGVVLGEPGCAYEKEEGETALGLDGEKVFSPGESEP